MITPDNFTLTKLQTVVTHIVQWDLICSARKKGLSRYWILLSIPTVFLTNVSLIIFLVSLGDKRCAFFSYSVTLGQDSVQIRDFYFCGKDCPSHSWKVATVSAQDIKKSLASSATLQLLPEAGLSICSFIKYGNSFFFCIPCDSLMFLMGFVDVGSLGCTYSRFRTIEGNQMLAHNKILELQQNKNHLDQSGQ